MRILYITNVPSPYRVNFFSELGKLCDLTVIYERTFASDRNNNWKEKPKNTFKEIYLNGKNIGTDNSFCPDIIKYIDKKYYLIVIGMYSKYTSMLAISYMKIKKINFVICTDGGFIKEESKLNLWIKRFFISSAEWWLSTGSKATEYLCHYGANLEKIYEYPFTSLSDDDVLEKSLSNAEKTYYKNLLKIKEEKIIISVGQFIHRKGYDVLLNACKEIDDNVGIYIIGGNPTQEYLNLQKKLNLKNLYFLNFKDKEELMKYYSAADIFVLPTREDIWGLVINEAMSKGLPIITTNKCIAGIEFNRKSNLVKIVPVEDVENLSRAINKVLTNSDLSRKMSQTSLKLIKEYTFSNMANVVFSNFKKIINDRR